MSSVVLESDYSVGAEHAREIARLKAAIARPEYKVAFTKALPEALRRKSWERGRASLEGHEQKALDSGSDPSGGALVPSDISANVFATLGQRSIFRRLATVVQTNRDVYQRPRFLPNADTGLSSQFVADWVGETPPWADTIGTTPAIGLVSAPIKKARYALLSSRDLMDDAPGFLEQQFGTEVGQGLAVVEDSAFTNGASASRPYGLLQWGNSQGLPLFIPQVDIQGTVAHTISNSTGSVGSVPKIEALIYSLPEQFRQSAVWMMQNGSIKAFRELITSTGGFQYPRGEMLGPNGCEKIGPWEVWANRGMDADGSTGNQPVFFGDLSGVLVATNQLLSVQVVTESRFAEVDQVLVVVFDRVGSAVMDPARMVLGTV